MLQAMWDDADATVQQRLQQLSADTDTPASGEAAGR
jgi:hypothetical protein